MATITVPEFTADGNNVLVNVEYDSVSLLITAIQFQNLTSFPASITWSSHTFTLPANTALTTLDTSSFNFLMVPVTNARGVLTVEIPGGDISGGWPA